MIPHGVSNTKFAALPRGARDLLPAACRVRRALTRRVLELVDGWGYEEVIPPAVEYFDVVGRGLSPAGRDRCVRFIEPGSAELVTLRPDVTPQIARMVALRLGGELSADAIVRFAYAADVVRQPDGKREQTEHHEVGVELIGDGSAFADVELISLAHGVLATLGLEGVRIDLAHTGIARAILGGLGLPESILERLHALLARKDSTGVRDLLVGADVREPVTSSLSALCDLHGSPATVLARARKVLRCRGVVEALDELEQVLEILSREDAVAANDVAIDLGEVRGVDYYTGLRLRIWAGGAAVPLVRGGRYDDLLSRYGAARPASGFTIDLDALEAALAHIGRLPSMARRGTSCLIAVADSASNGVARGEASRLARDLRARGQRAIVQLDFDGERAKQWALSEGITAMVIVDRTPSGGVTTEHWTYEAGAWRTADREVSS